LVLSFPGLSFRTQGPLIASTLRSRQKGFHPVELIEVFSLSLQTVYLHVTSGCAKIPPQRGQAGQGGCSCFDDELKFETKLVVPPDSGRLICDFTGPFI
jgi:hypothetical protein